MRLFTIYIVCIISLCGLLNGRTWTNNEGQTMEASYAGTREADGVVVVVFLKSDGGRYQFPLKDLSEEDRLYVTSEKAAAEAPAKAEVAAAAPSSAPVERAKTIFERDIAQNLVRSDGRRLSGVSEDEIGPKDYYAIYYSAAWCPPCRAFTPKLVDFYKRQKRRNGDKFEIIFVSSDKDETAMTGYMRDYNMAWPALDFGKKKSSRALTQYSGRGIPCLVLVDKDGNVISHSYEGDKYVGPTKVLQDLEAKLKQ